MWDGTTWSDVGGGVDNYVYSLVIDSNDNLYVGGSFVYAGLDVLCNSIARWNGTIWSSLDNGVGGGNVNAIALDGNFNLYVGGYFTTAGPLNKPVN